MKISPPGPRDWFFGLGIGMRAFRDPLRFFPEMAHTYGDVVLVRVGPYDTYVLNHPDLTREVLITKAKSFRKWERQTAIFRKVDGNGLVNTEGDFWLRQRRLIQKAFHKARLAVYADKMVALTQRRLERWTAGTPFNLEPEMSELSMEIVGETLFGVDLRDEAKRINAIAETLRDTFIDEFLTPFPLPDWLPLPSKRRMRRVIAELHAFVDGIIRARRASKDDKGDLLSMLLLAVDEQGDGTGMSDQQARDEAVTLFNGGHDSTSAALSWTCYFVARHAEVQDRLRAEVKTVLGDRSATFEDVPRLAYAGMVVKESMRLNPPTVALFTREAITDVEIGGYTLAKGSLVALSPFVTHRDARWFPEPMRFDPERFAPGRAEGLPEHAYFPFGAGPHVCIGNSFAMMEITLVLAALMQRFRLELTSGQEDIVPELKVSLRPKGGVWVKAC